MHTIPLLLSPETKKQQEQEEYEVQRLMARAQGGLQLRSAIALFTLVALITNLGMFKKGFNGDQSIFIHILAICLLLMFYGLISVHRWHCTLKALRDEAEREIRSLYLHSAPGLHTFFTRVYLCLMADYALGTFVVADRSWWKTGLFSLLVAGPMAAALLLFESIR